MKKMANLELKEEGECRLWEVEENRQWEEEEQQVQEQEESWLWLASEQEVVSGTGRTATEGVDGRRASGGQLKERRKQLEGGGWGLLGLFFFFDTCNFTNTLAFSPGPSNENAC